jgi:Fur family peroxide stress response transcriptional regulator
MKYSKQRELIERAVIDGGSHPSAGEVYDALHPRYPSLSLGTVYRNLTLLSNNGVIRKLHMPDGSDRFDGSVRDHAHAICTRCGKVKDVEAAFGPGLAETVLTETGFVMTGSQILITGLCESCAKKEETKDA